MQKLTFSFLKPTKAIVVIYGILLVFLSPYLINHIPFLYTYSGHLTVLIEPIAMVFMPVSFMLMALPLLIMHSLFSAIYRISGDISYQNNIIQETALLFSLLIYIYCIAALFTTAYMNLKNRKQEKIFFIILLILLFFILYTSFLV